MVKGKYNNVMRFELWIVSIEYIELDMNFLICIKCI